MRGLISWTGCKLALRCVAKSCEKKCVLLLFLSFFFSVNYIASAEMPDHTTAHLAEILAQDEFSGRLEEVSFWEELKEKVIRIAMFKAREIWYSVQQFLQTFFRSQDSGWLDFFSWFAEILRWLEIVLVASVKVFVVVAVIALSIYVSYRFILPFVLKSGFIHTADVPSKETNLEKIDLEDLIKKGEYLRALVMLRIELRNLLAGKYLVQEAQTDREVMKIIKPDFVSDLFVKTAAVFELVFFAGRPLRFEEVGELVEAYSRSLRAESEQSNEA